MDNSCIEWLKLSLVFLVSGNNACLRRCEIFLYNQNEDSQIQIESKCPNGQVHLNQFASSQDCNLTEDLHNLNKSTMCKQWLYPIELVFF